MRKSLILGVILWGGVASSHPLLNLNPEDSIVYDNVESSPYAISTPSISRPMEMLRIYKYSENRDRIRLYMNALSSPGFFLKPLNSITIRSYYTSEKVFVVPNASGTLLREGWNFHSFLDGYLSLGNRAVVYYQIRYVKDREDNKASLYRAYGKLRLGQFALSAGKDNVHLGPGENSLMLSSNTEPFPLVKLETRDYIKAFGKWGFLFVHGNLQEDRNDRDNPNLLALRVVWKPVDPMEIGVTRTAMYGGEGRPALSLSDYPKFIAGIEDNIPYGKYDADSYGSIDISIFPPIHRIVPFVKSTRLYFQEAGTDLLAWWQEEDRGSFPLPFGFRLLSTGYLAGALISTDKDIIRIEYTRINFRWYRHALYPIDGYTYKGLSLGHPYGSDLAHFFLSHRRYIDNSFSLSYRLGYYRQPVEQGTPMERYYVKLSGEKRLKSLIISGFVRMDSIKNYDANPHPVQFNIEKADRRFITSGISISWRL